MFTKPTYISFLLYVAFLTCLFSACSSENQGDIMWEERGREVSFDVSDGSRSSVSTTFDEFAVYGDMKFEANSPSIIFNKTKVELINGVWGYQGTQYWFPEHEHSFVAVSPLSVLEIGNPQYSDSQLSFIYTLPTTSGNLVKDNEVVDIMAATHRRLYSDIYRDNGVVTPVNLEFSHLMSLVNFLIGIDENSDQDASFEIHKLEISGFGTSAEFSIKPAPRQSNSQTNDSEIEINLIADRARNGQFSIEFDEPIKVTYGNEVKMFEDNKAIIMLPQTFSGDDKIQIGLTYSVNDETEPIEVSANLSSFKWERGRSYNYKIKLELEQKDVNMVISEATIVPWNLVDDHNEVDAR